MKRQCTFEEAAILWQQHKKGRIKESSWLRYDLMLHTMVLPIFGDMTDIPEQAVQEYVLDCHTRKYARSTMKSAVALLKEVMKFAAKHGMMEYMPWDIEYPRDDRPRKLPVLSKSDHRKLLKYLTEHITPQRMPVMLALSTGMRIGEVCALRWDNVDMLNRTITVSATRMRTYDRRTKSSKMFTNTPKTVNSYREIPISAQLHIALRKVCEMQDQDEYVCGWAGPTEPRTAREMYAKLLDKLGIPPIKFHGLRHTFATRCIEAGVDVKTVSAILGHSNVATTLNLYVHPTIDNKRDAMKRLAKNLNM